MADLPYNIIKINDIEVSLDAPVTEALFNKLGGAINFLLDKNFRVVEFTTLGPQLFTVPADVNVGAFFGCGGGGGGGSGTTGIDISNLSSTGGSGGAGTDLHSSGFFKFTPGDSLTINVGDGGNANTNGGDCSISGFTNGVPNQIVFPGGTKGNAGLLQLAVAANPVNPGATTHTGSYIGTLTAFFGGYGGQVLASGNGAAGGQAPASSRIFGGTFAANGTPGTGGVGGGTASGGGGVGGRSQFGVGGNGGNGATNGQIGSPGFAALNTNYGAGGGGGGGGTEAGNRAGGAGGKGAQGIIYLLYIGVP